MAIAISPSLLPVAEPVKDVRKPAAQIFHLFLLAVALVVGACLQAIGPAWSRAIFEQVKPGTALGFAALLLALLVSIAAHELGHLSAALFLNYGILGFAVGPFRCERQHGKTSSVIFSGIGSTALFRPWRAILHNCWRLRTIFGGGCRTRLYPALIDGFAWHGDPFEQLNRRRLAGLCNSGMPVPNLIFFFSC